MVYASTKEWLMSDFIIIDRRKNPTGKNLPNRQRFIKHVKKFLSEKIKKSPHGSITDKSDKNVGVPVDGIDEPKFDYDQNSGIWDRVLPGNKEFTKGDKINKQNGGGGSGGRGEAGHGSSEDDFVFSINRDEYLDILFDDLELPDLVKKSEKQTTTFKNVRAGYRTWGPPPTIDIVKSYKNSLGRRIALVKPLERRIEELEQEDTEEARLELEELRKKRKSIPWMDPLDIRYKRWEKVPIPNTKAVMFCLMDVSASMGEKEKEIAKRMFLLVYEFLRRKYKSQVDIVFVKHTDEAFVCDEEEFFYGQTSGGTEISKGLEAIQQQIKERYQVDNWNIYVVQATDGDNYSPDNQTMEEKMFQLLPIVQYYVYTEIKDEHGQSIDFFYTASTTSVWEMMQNLGRKYSNIISTQVDNVDKVIPTFRHLFSRKEQK